MFPESSDKTETGGYMTNTLKLEIEDLKKSLVEMAETVDSMLADSIALIRDRRDVKARVSDIKKMDNKVDSMEIEMDAKCIRLLGLYAPEAGMLRTVVTVMKINNDVERIGDHAVNIARLVGKISDYPPIQPLAKAAEMGDRALEMFRMSMDAFINMKKDLAYEVSGKDKEVDGMEKQIIQDTLDHLKNFPESTQAATCLIVLVRNLERAADLSTNISEDTHYVITGEVRKHSSLKSAKTAN